jgi:hypothetical protein
VESLLPEYLADTAAFTLATGLRASNVTRLQCSQVDVVWTSESAAASEQSATSSGVAYEAN